MSICSDEVIKSLRVLQEMLQDRRVEGSDYINLFTNNEVVNLMKTKTAFNIDIGNSMRIIYILSGRPKMIDIKKFLPEGDDLFESYILVTRDKLNSADQKKLLDISNIQTFNLKELQINITKHELVPKHELITDDAFINELVSKYQIKSRYQFPIILKTDAMAKYLNAKPGNIIKVTRFSPTSAEYIVYRCCM